MSYCVCPKYFLFQFFTFSTCTKWFIFWTSSVPITCCSCCEPVPVEGVSYGQNCAEVPGQAATTSHPVHSILKICISDVQYCMFNRARIIGIRYKCAKLGVELKKWREYSAKFAQRSGLKNPLTWRRGKMEWQVNVVSPFAAVHRFWLLSNTFRFIFTPFCHFVPLTIIFALFRHYFVSRGASLQDAALVQIHIIICCACPALTRLRFSFNSQVTLYTPVSILHHITCTMKKNLIVMIKLKCHL